MTMARIQTSLRWVAYAARLLTPPELAVAVALGEPGATKSLLSLQENILGDIIQAILENALGLAASYGQEGITRHLLREGAASVSALGLAVRAGSAGTVVELLRIKTGRETPDKNGYPPLHYGAAAGHVDITEMLLATGVAIDETNPDRLTALHIAAMTGQVAIVEMPLEAKASAILVNTFGCDALKLAARAGSGEIVGRLIAKGADVNALAPDDNKITQLYIAARWDVDGPNDNNVTPLHAAVSSRSSEVFQLLIKAGASVNAADNDFDLPLLYAVELDSEEIAQALLTAGADINALDTKGSTPLLPSVLQRFCSDGSEALVVVLTAQLDQQNDREWTALHAAYDSPEVIELLLGAGADSFLQDHMGYTPLTLVAERKSPQSYDELVKAKTERAFEWSESTLGVGSRSCDLHTSVNMKFFENIFVYDYSFPAVSLAYFLRYPNPYSRHVLTTDVIDRYVDPQTQRLHTIRLHLKKSKVPSGILKLLPKGIGGSDNSGQSYILETTVVDAREGWMESESRNMEWTGILSVVEKQLYQRLPIEGALDNLEGLALDDKRGEQTTVKTTVTFRSRLGQGKLLARRKADSIGDPNGELEEEAPKRGFFSSLSTAGIQRTIELIGVRRTREAVLKSKEGMNIVLERLRHGGIVGVLEGIRQDRETAFGTEGPWKRVWIRGQGHTEDDGN
ncbi:hypothetical protein BBP40_005787 [Aspergillus hancockii]|nr:hypothetical protein BBP40_005787 [Aspergillus hancockii]